MAARASTQGRRPAGTQAAGKGRSLVWLQGLACGALATLATPTAVLLLLLLAPGLAALMLDQGPGKPVARSMLLYALAATVQPVMTLWHNGQTMRWALSLATDPGVIGIAWLAAGVGWLVGEVAPLLVRLILDARGVGRSMRLKAARSRLVELWGETALPGTDAGEGQPKPGMKRS